jgi:hypothetical protein
LDNEELTRLIDEVLRGDGSKEVEYDLADASRKTERLLPEEARSGSMPEPAAGPAPDEVDPLGHRRLGDARYCGRCGFDYEAGRPFELARALVLVLTADPGRSAGASCPPPPAVGPACFVLDRSEAPKAIGRGPEAAIPIPWDPAVSRVQAEVLWADQGWAIREGRPTNPTRLRGRALEPGRRERLARGDVIELGCYARLEVAPPSPPTPSALEGEGSGVRRWTGRPSERMPPDQRDGGDVS